MAIKKTKEYKILNRPDWQCPFIEDVWVTLIPASGRHLHICLCYIPGVTSPNNFENYCSLICERVLNLRNDDVILMGDQNVPEFVNQHLNRSTKFKCLIDLCDTCGLSQQNPVKNGLSNTTLDLVFSNCHLNIEESSDSIVEIDKYHPPFVMDKKITQCNSKSEIMVFRKWKNADWGSINNDLSGVDWDLSFENCRDVDEVVEVFYDTLTSHLNVYCPLQVKKTNSNGIIIGKVTKNLLRKKRKAHAKWKKSNSDEDRKLFEKLKDECDASLIEEEKKFTENIESDLQYNPKKFFNYVNSIKSNGAGIADFITLGEETASCKKDAANLCGKFFASTFSPVDNYHHSSTISHSSHLNSWNKIFISVEKIEEKLMKLNVNKSTGPDGLPPALFKNCASTLTYPLYIIMNSSLVEGKMPTKWKMASVVPIHKCGSQNDAANYRPISKLSICAKVFDSIIADELFSHFSTIITEHQHGFFRGRSTVTNLIGYTESIEKCMGSGGQVDVIYTDFSKAFDKVSHNVLLSKLHSHGVSGMLLKWFGSYLKGRKFRVQIGNTLSDPYDVTSSVVQGSHCGPVLFAIFINDIQEILNTNYNCYADDIKIYKQICTIEDCHMLQNNIRKLEQFSIDNKLSLNVEKCFVSSFTKKKKNFLIYDYKIDQRTLERKDEIKDLGVIYSDTGGFNSHIDYICSRAKRVLGFITRNSKFFKYASTVTRLYTCFVRPLVEYACLIWSPTTTTKVQQLEGIQHRFLRYVAKKFFNDSNEHIDYEYYEATLKLQKLELRRIIIDITHIIKSFNGGVDCSTFLHEFKLQVPRRSSRAHNVFQIPNHNSVISRLMNNFNKYLNDADALCMKTGVKQLRDTITQKFTSPTN